MELGTKSKVIRFLIHFCRAGLCQDTVLVCIVFQRMSNVYLGSRKFSSSREEKYRVQSCLEIKYDCFNPPLQYYRTGKEQQYSQAKSQQES